MVALEAKNAGTTQPTTISMLLPQELDPGDAVRFQLTYAWRIIGTELVADGTPAVALIVCEKATPTSTGQGSALNGSGETLARGEGSKTIMFDGTSSRLKPNGLPLQLVLENGSVDSGAIVVFSAWVRWFMS